MQVNDVRLEVVEGDARNVLCDAVEKHHASMLVVGSHGYGAVKRYEIYRFPNTLVKLRYCTTIMAFMNHVHVNYLHALFMFIKICSLRIKNAYNELLNYA